MLNGFVDSSSFDRLNGMKSTGPEFSGYSALDLGPHSPFLCGLYCK